MHNLHHRALRADLAARDPGADDLAELAPPGSDGAAQPGLSPPPESETARVASASRIEEQGTTDRRDCDSVPGADQAGAAEHKAEANMRARAELAECGLIRLENGEFLLTKWGMAKSCPDLRSVGALLNRLGGSA